MATPSDTFRIQMPPHSRFIAYHPPPTPKIPSRRPPSKKIQPAADGWHEIDEILKIESESNALPWEPEVVDLTISGRFHPG